MKSSRNLRLEDTVRDSRTARMRLIVDGVVQGVGFRPFVHRLATKLGLRGWVSNSTAGVIIEVEGPPACLRQFLDAARNETPPRASVQSLRCDLVDPLGCETFEIRESDVSGTKRATVLPDIATCPDCLKDIFDPNNRRYRYPFTNCTNCGPRFSIIKALPYDRSGTSMAQFTMCRDCRTEYENPGDRRFHAQPNACPVCGPHLELWDAGGKAVGSRSEALAGTTDAIRRGEIVAIKGLGGFQLIADARREDTIRKLRLRKKRKEKPLAVMYPSLELIRDDAQLVDLEEQLLCSPESPIVLVRRRKPSSLSGSAIAASVAPGNPWLGVMLPYTPLHHLLLDDLGFPVVATSGNLSDEPIVTCEREAVERLGGIVRLFLVHNRPISQHVDDSVVRVVAGRELVLRRARGYSPLPVELTKSAPPVFAVGADLKGALAVSVGSQAFISQHIANLETKAALDRFGRVAETFRQLYELDPVAVACDLHPDYISTNFAEQTGLPLIPVQHHHAHVLSCAAEHKLTGPLLGVAWDGTGYGPDKTVWGGEFLTVCEESWTRVAAFRPFLLPGGDKGAAEPRRAALGLLYTLFGQDVFAMRKLHPVKAFAQEELRIVKTMLQKKINSYPTSSAGRLFDAVAAITGVRQITTFEGQAAMDLEFLIEDTVSNEQYRFTLAESGSKEENPALVLDWAPVVEAILDDLDRGASAGHIALKFHNGLVEAIVKVARVVAREKIVLSGGCFQNKYLTERAVERLSMEGFRPYWHQRIPPNDGGIALGQLTAALQMGGRNVSGSSREDYERERG